MIERFDPVADDDDFTRNSGLLERPDGQLGVVRVVFHEQNDLRFQWLCTEMTSVLRSHEC